MQLGYLTACLPARTLDELADLAVDLGFTAMEVAAWPDLGERKFTATHIDVESISDREIERIRQIFATRNLSLSSLAYYDNNLHPDQAARKQINDHLRRCIEVAAKLDCPTVGTFIGRDPGKTVAENLDDARRVFPPLVDLAGENNISIVIENCVMEGWHPDGYPGNLAYSPELWEWMFELGLYLNYDPSHLLWMGIDPVTALRPYVDKVLHAQAKDIELFVERRNRFGFPGRAVSRSDPWDVGWWRYRVPGLGQVDWTRVVDVLHEGGFTGVLSVEHEDPVWGGTEDRITAGLRIAHRTLSPLVNIGTPA
jgi:sugar phosphate isomerase/epimerase